MGVDTELLRAISQTGNQSPENLAEVLAADEALVMSRLRASQRAGHVERYESLNEGPSARFWHATQLGLDEAAKSR